MHLVNFSKLGNENPGVLNRYKKENFRRRWHDFVVHAYWATSEDGLLRVWVNDQRRVDYSGNTRTEGNDYTYQKFGT